MLYSLINNDTNDIVVNDLTLPTGMTILYDNDSVKAESGNMAEVVTRSCLDPLSPYYLDVSFYSVDAENYDPQDVQTIKFDNDFSGPVYDEQTGALITPATPLNSAFNQWANS